MENIKKMIIIVITIIILLIISLLIVKYLDKKYREENFENQITVNIVNKIDEVKDKNEFFAVKSCVTKYLSFVAQDDKDIVYSFLDKNYIEHYNITNENAIPKMEEYGEPTFFVDKMYVIQDTIDVYTYFVYGKVIDKQNAKVTDYNIAIRLDKQRDLFSVIPYNFVEDNKYNIEIGNTITLKYNEISDNTYNQFAFKNITDTEMIEMYINEIKDRIIYDVESLYNKLDKTYAQNKFANIEEYKKYMTKKLSTIYKLKIDKYQIKDYDEYKQYICVDQNENYYIINEINPGQYELILDLYTIDIPEYVQKYNEYTDNQKGAICIEKFIKNINDENYMLAYNMLSEGFRDNYFKTEASFKEYATKQFLGKKLSFKEVQTQEGLYVYKVTLLQENLGEIEKNFIVKLKEGTNFELSFEM